MVASELDEYFRSARGASAENESAQPENESQRCRGGPHEHGSLKQSPGGRSQHCDREGRKAAVELRGLQSRAWSKTACQSQGLGRHELLMCQPVHPNHELPHPYGLGSQVVDAMADEGRPKYEQRQQHRELDGDHEASGTYHGDAPP